MSNISVLMPENGEQTFTEKQLVKFEITDGAIQEMKEKYLPLTIAGIDDRNGFNIVHNARMIVKGKRILVEKKRKELNESAKTYISSVNKEAQRITDLLSPIEDHLEGEETRIEQARETLKREAEERENQRIQDRINKVAAYGYAVDYSEIKGMTDIAFADLLEQARIEHEKDLAAKAEAKRLADEEAEKLKEERAKLNVIRAEQERIAKWQLYEANILKAEQVRIQKEQEAREKAIKTEQDKIDAEKKAIELQKQKEEQARLKLIEDQKREAEQKIENERLAKEAIEREKALAPDREKIQDFVIMLKGLKYPTVKEDEAKKIVTGSKIRIVDTIAIINTWLKSSVLLAEYNESENITLVKEG